MLHNPILPGFNPDPCICRCGEDYYIAVSSFEWFPGVPVYHSRDMKSWTLLTHILSDESMTDLRRLPSAKGIWAPCLTYCEEDGLFYLLYSCMNSMNARYFDVDNFLITAPSITGPWSEPIYLHSAGFDPSILHDKNGKKWIVSLEWETRDGYHKPGTICAIEYNSVQREVVGYPKCIWAGGTKRGCIEGPHLYQRNGYYYLMCAEGGTGYGHCVTVGRSKSVFGPYESDPCNPILTSTPDFNEMDNDDAMKLNRYNPASYLQKAGHGSLIETTLGEWYLVHHCGRPFLPELRCTLGRETCIQKMKWTDDGWIRLIGEDSLAKEYVTPSRLPDVIPRQDPVQYDFEKEIMPLCFYSPRIAPETFCTLKEKPGYLRIRGQESLSSLNRASFVGHKLTALSVCVTTKLEFEPHTYQQYAGLAIYYDNMNYILLRKTFEEEKNAEVLDLIRVENGFRSEVLENSVLLVPNQSIFLRLIIDGRSTKFLWSMDGLNYHRIGIVFDTSEFSDEYCKYGEFTGTFVGMACVDALFHKAYADFDFFTYQIVKNNAPY